LEAGIFNNMSVCYGKD